jgi:hypothetical protein
MADTEGMLPPTPQPPRRDATETGSLPPTTSIAGARGPLPKAATPSAPPAASQTITERIAAITASGGLRALPAAFGDADGDWVTVRSDNPFTVLYLDHQQAFRITAEMVSRHRDLLLRFWQEKLRSMSQGAARFAILKKYGGPDESERLVRGYPEAIERAYEDLATQGRIEATYASLIAEQEETLFRQIDEKLEAFLVDGVLQPAEARALLELGDRAAIVREKVATRIHSKLRARGLVALSPTPGLSLSEQLLSSAWTHPLPRNEKVEAIVEPKRKNLFIPAMLFFLFAALFLFFNSILNSRHKWSYRVSEPTETIVSTTSVTASVYTETASQIVNVPQPPVTESSPAPMVQAVVLPPKEAEPPPELRISVRERRRVHDELESIRQDAENDPQVSLDRAVVLDRTLELNAAEYASERLDLANLRSELQKLVMEKQLLAAKLLTQEEAEERARAERDREWEQRIAQIETFFKQKNYSAAKSLADQLLAEPDLPPPVAERAKRLADDAITELQKIFSGAKVTSKTGRSPRTPKP